MAKTRQKTAKTTNNKTTALSEGIFDSSNAVSANLEGLIRKIQALEPFLDFVKCNHPDVYKEFFNTKELPQPASVLTERFRILKIVEDYLEGPYWRDQMKEIEDAVCKPIV